MDLVFPLYTATYFFKSHHKYTIWKWEYTIEI